jgi:hypothetical protein
MSTARDAVMTLPGLVSFWDFQQPAGQQRLAHGQGAYALHEAGGTIDRSDGGIFGPYCAQVAEGRWLECPREACPLLNLHGPEAEVSVLAWVRREDRRYQHAQAVAGIWHDAIHRRQYGLFIDIRQQDSSDQVAGQISCVGAQNGGQKYNCEAAIGSTRISSGWHFLACTFGRAESGGNEARVYIDGRLDQRPGLNPSSWSGGIANGGAGGADFTVAAVHRAGEVGEWFVGAIGGVAVCNRAVSAQAIEAVHALVPMPAVP